jgi:hypothetical protein
MQFQEWMFDKRVLQRNLRRGLISRADYDKFVKALPDASENAAPLLDDERSPKKPASPERTADG